ncbi:hypothetical protein JYT84_00570 [bacterium AH-315-M10]|nr:hypothetical protein [bacterium AH-315-M10]
MTTRKPSKQAAEEASLDRRREIYKLRMRGIPPRAIARLLGETRRTIDDDLEQIKKDAANRARNADVHEVVGEAVHFYNEIEYQALTLYHEAEKEQDQRAFIETALRAEQQKLWIMFVTGIIPTEATKHDIQRFKEHALAELAQRPRTRGEGERH